MTVGSKEGIQLVKSAITQIYPHIYIYIYITNHGKSEEQSVLSGSLTLGGHDTVWGEGESGKELLYHFS